MRVHVRAGLGFLLALGSAPAFSQAAAESVLLNSNSAAATAKAGTSLGDALNGAGKNLGGQLKTVTAGDRSHPASTSRGGKAVAVPSAAKNSGKTPTVTNKPSSGGSSSTGSSMITSIQGGQVKSNAPQKPVNTAASPPAAPAK